VIVRDLPYFTPALSSQRSKLEDTMPEYEMPIDEQIKLLSKKLDSLDRSLEGLQGLRESMDAKFEAAAKNNADQMGLLKSVLVHVRQRVDGPERPGARRRKS
jgi:hypothetical protein